MTETATPKPPRLLDQVRDALRVRHMSLRTEKAYLHWIRHYILFHGKRHPSEMGEVEMNAFLTHLAVDKRVSPSTQTQALCALLFLYRTVLGREVGELEGLIRAKRRRHLPVVLTRDEVRSALSRLTGVNHLFLSFLYGTGMRLMEGLRLRVKDVDFSQHQITIRDGKGGKDRTTMLPSSLESPLREHLRVVRELHRQDLEEGYGRVHLPYALETKYPGAESEWKWQYVFPAAGRSQDPQTGRIGRYHLSERQIQRAFRAADNTQPPRHRANPLSRSHLRASRPPPSWPPKPPSAGMPSLVICIHPPAERSSGGGGGSNPYDLHSRS